MNINIISMYKRAQTEIGYLAQEALCENSVLEDNI
jgi:ABC-type lipopolysaccharide export system ATPase subunit